MPTLDTWAELEPAWWRVGPTWATIFQQPPEWKPEPAVLINGVDFSGSTIDQISIRRGRDSVYVEPTASYASVLLRSVGGSLAVNIGDELTVRINSATLTPITLFRGRVSDVEVSVQAASQPVARYRLTVVGPLAGANRRQVLADGRAVELDGARAEAAITEALGTANIDAAQFDGGVFSLAALDSEVGGYAALGIAQEAAASGGGVVYETREGLIAYADADRRATTLDENDFTVIGGEILDLGGMNASSSLSELANRIVLDWDDGTVIEEVPESISQFGLFVRRISTILENESDAEIRAIDLAQNLSVPVFKSDQFRLLLNNADLPLLDQLVFVEPNDGFSFRRLPAALGFTRLDAFVEGLEWRIDQFTVELGLFASDERLSVGLVYWGRVNETLEWGDVDAGLAWEDVGRLL
jgi:hypothetical protein